MDDLQFVQYYERQSNDVKKARPVLIWISLIRNKLHNRVPVSFIKSR